MTRRAATAVMLTLAVFGLLLGATIHAAWPYDDGGDYGNGNDQRHCHESQNCRGSFSPGPFDRSPVDISHNQFCVGPNSCPSDGKQDPPKKD